MRINKFNKKFKMMTVELPENLFDEFDSYVIKRGTTKRSIVCMAVSKIMKENPVGINTNEGSINDNRAIN